MGRKKLTPKRAILSQRSTEEDVRLAAREWAEFLYEEYCLEKQNSLNLSEKHVTVEKLTNHDRLNS
jgi:hypothetical protein